MDFAQVMPNLFHAPFYIASVLPMRWISRFIAGSEKYRSK
jgi:hypothetical protein